MSANPVSIELNVWPMACPKCGQMPVGKYHRINGQAMFTLKCTTPTCTVMIPSYSDPREAISRWNRLIRSKLTSECVDSDHKQLQFFHELEICPQCGQKPTARIKDDRDPVLFDLRCDCLFSEDNLPCIDGLSSLTTAAERWNATVKTYTELRNILTNSVNLIYDVPKMVEDILCSPDSETLPPEKIMEIRGEELILRIKRISSGISITVG